MHEARVAAVGTRYILPFTSYGALCSAKSARLLLGFSSVHVFSKAAVQAIAQAHEAAYA